MENYTTAVLSQQQQQQQPPPSSSSSSLLPPRLSSSFLPLSDVLVSSSIQASPSSISELAVHGAAHLMESSAASERDQVKLDKNKRKEKKVRKHRYAFQTRSQVDILDDGYRWRKYGQKAVKNNRFPRSYYRCTYQGCNVKKQVQRLSKDEGVVVTTYEGVHSHPIEKPSDNFEHILKEMQIYSHF